VAEEAFLRLQMLVLDVEMCRDYLGLNTIRHTRLEGMEGPEEIQGHVPRFPGELDLPLWHCYLYFPFSGPRIIFS